MPAGVQARGAGDVGDEIADVEGVEAVDVLIGRDGEEDAVGVDVRRQGHLDEDAVDVGAAVEAFDDGEQFVGGDGGGRRDLFAEDAEFVAGFDLAADVDLRRRDRRRRGRRRGREGGRHGRANRRVVSARRGFHRGCVCRRGGWRAYIGEDNRSGAEGAGLGRGNVSETAVEKRAVVCE